MSLSCNELASVLVREGTDKVERNQGSLNPDELKLQDFSLNDWMQFAYSFAKDVNYFAINDDQQPDGDWEDFFPDKAEITELLKQIDTNNDLTAHLTLFVCFLKLLDYSKNRFNELTRRHLDFYYGEILQVAKLPEINDKVYVLFELAKKIDSATIPIGTALDAGKNDVGERRIYRLTEEFYPNRAGISSLKTVYYPFYASLTGNSAIKSAPVANSTDGEGKTALGVNDAWYPFGYENGNSNYPDLPDAKLGFALASPVLELSEGARTIVTDILFDSVTDIFTQQELVELLSVYYSGEEGWVGPLKLSTGQFQMKQENGAVINYQTQFQSQHLTLTLTLDYEAEPVVAFNQSIHHESFVTNNPVIRFLVSTATFKGLQLYKNLSSKVSNIDLKVIVSGMEKNILESDFGRLNSEKPFYPFTSQPVKGSRLSVFNEEVFSKNWKNIDVTIHWKNTPDSFNDLYRAYDQTFEETVAKSWLNGIDVQQTYTIKFNPVVKVVKPALVSRGLYSNYNSIVADDTYFKANSYLFLNKKWSLIDQDIVLFNILPPSQDDQVYFETYFSVGNIGGQSSTSNGVSITLNQSFLHELYPKIYALAMMSTSDNVLVPNQPYTPFAEKLTLSYTAENNWNASLVTEDAFNERSVQLFHEHPFGQAEAHAYLRNSSVQPSSLLTLAPVYNEGGELYIGIENINLQQQVSLLVQVKEGTENTLVSTFTSSEEVSWDILCTNYWLPLKKVNGMVLNQVDNFLTAGIVRFAIPDAATTNNTLLPGGLTWVRATLRKDYDAVCRVLGIYAQATLAEFDSEGVSDTAHLEKGIPAETITKLVDRNSLIKSVDQPYNSIGGVQAESDSQYYRRVSERLRHKQRAINLWDYEHLVLQQFPEIFQVKCLNHTCCDSFNVPGNVLLVVIPDTTLKNVFDSFQPRVSQGVLTRITDYINQYNSMHVNTCVINPEYEEIQVSLNVQFYDGYDIPLHILKLNEDIIRFLSPWAYDQKKIIRFDHIIYRSQLIDFIENLDYVDYLENVVMKKNGVVFHVSASPVSPKHILVSAKKHLISTNITTCQDTGTNQNRRTCQQ